MNNVAEQKNGRIPFFDTIRFGACFWVFLTHFIAYYLSDYFGFWTDEPTKYLLLGISEKFAVAGFAVILGYFAAISGRGKKSLLHYSVNDPMGRICPGVYCKPSRNFGRVSSVELGGFQCGKNAF